MNILVLENIRSAYNVGSIFRTADAVGVDRIILVGHTPAPVDRFGRKRKDIAKTALGAEEVIPWEKIDSFCEYLKDKKGNVYSIEQTRDSKDYRSYTKIKGDNYFVFGNEIDGISQETLSISDNIYQIPMNGKKESLNVSVSVGVFLYKSMSENN